MIARSGEAALFSGLFSTCSVREMIPRSRNRAKAFCAEGQHRTGDRWFFRSGPGQPVNAQATDTPWDLLAWTLLSRTAGTPDVSVPIRQARAFAYMVVGGSGT